MGSLITTLAFPAPSLPQSEYQKQLLDSKDFRWLPTAKEGERVPALWMSPQESRAAGWVILYAHGNAEDLVLIAPGLYHLARVTRCQLLGFDYPGYSVTKAEGAVPSEEGCIRGIDAAWRWLVEEQGVAPSRIVIYGRSIGTGPAVDLAARQPAAAGLVLLSPIESGARAVFGHATSWLGFRFDIFKNYKKMPRVECKGVVMHGTADSVVPCANGRALHAMLKHPFTPLWVEGRGHNDMPEKKVLDHVLRFLDWLESSEG